MPSCCLLGHLIKISLCPKSMVYFKMWYNSSQNINVINVYTHFVLRKDPIENLSNWEKIRLRKDPIEKRSNWEKTRLRNLEIEWRKVWDHTDEQIKKSLVLVKIGKPSWSKQWIIKVWAVKMVRSSDSEQWIIKEWAVCQKIWSVVPSKKVIYSRANSFIF